ncbi:tRNA ligase [Cichlidogyrus casuarinus]|uniref:DNA ligase n=1 Tax=Cichlidogyrus casuarinus TaxID=1844966 RepID=A0ABD2QNA5_9PLAT
MPQKATKTEEKKPPADMSSFFQIKSKNDSETNNKELQVYDPTKENYHPVKDAIWSLGDNVPYAAFAQTLEAIESISGRLKMIETLANFFRSVGVLSPSDLAICANMTLNQLGPAYSGLELGIGENILSKAISSSTGSNMAKIKSELKTTGDLGKVASSLRSKQRIMMKPKPLDMQFIFKKLQEIAQATGSASQGKKVDLISRLLVACVNGSEAKYIVRSLQGKLRIGLAEQSVLMALGQAAALTPFHKVLDSYDVNSGANKDLILNESYLRLDKKLEKADIEKVVVAVKTAFCQRPNFEPLVRGLLLDGPEKLQLHCPIQPGIPIRPMLAHPTKGVDDLLRRFDNSTFSCEYKYDGERAQIHVLDTGSVNIYSRNQEDNTTKYPDIISVMNNQVVPNSKFTEELADLIIEMKLAVEQEVKQMIGQPIKSAILDSEAVAWDKEKEQILPFQILSTRKRKDVKEEDVKVQVCIYAFDLLFLNGISLVQQTFRQRRELLRTAFKDQAGQFHFATSIDSGDTEKIAEFLDQAVKGNCEGLMVKTLDRNSTYEIAKRSHNWLKLKKDYLDGVGDTLDLVPIGAFYGSGKRAGVYGAFLLACYESDEEQFQTICKLGTGLSDADLKKFSETLSEVKIEGPKSYYSYNAGLLPDVWFDASCVWEIKAADMSISPAHRAAEGMADPEKGISLRFPRFLRERPDKKVEDATSARQVYEMYISQEQIRNQLEKGVNKEDDDEFY